LTKSPLEIVSRIVVRILAGDTMTLTVFRLYFLERRSTSEIASILGVSKHTVRGRIMRLSDHAGLTPFIENLIRRVLMVLNGCEPIIKYRENDVVCKLCKRTIAITSDPEAQRIAAIQHIYGKHQDLVTQLARELLRKVRDNARATR